MDDIDDRESLLAFVKNRQWFYAYTLPDGTIIQVPPALQALHDSRRDMMRDVLRSYYGERLASVRAVDLACHQGFFSFELAKLCRAVEGIDVNGDSLGGARAIARLNVVSNVTFRQADIMTLPARSIAPAEIVLMFGLIYHVEDPMRLLRLAAEITQEVLLIETQLLPLELETNIEWGSASHFRAIRGLFALVDDQDNSEGGVTSLALVPSTNALRVALTAMGFRRVDVLSPPAGAPEQLQRGRRAVLAAYR